MSYFTQLHSFALCQSCIMLPMLSFFFAAIDSAASLGSLTLTYIFMLQSFTWQLTWRKDLLPVNECLHHLSLGTCTVMILWHQLNLLPTVSKTFSAAVFKKNKRTDIDTELCCSRYCLAFHYYEQTYWLVTLLWLIMIT